MKELDQLSKTSQEFVIRKGKFIAFLGMLMIFCFLQSCEKEILEMETADRKAKVNVKAVDLELIADNMVSPIGLVAAPDESGRLFVIDQIGKIWMINSEGERSEDPYLDLSSKIVELGRFYDERGLLGFAFHPDFASNGRLFAYYTAPDPSGEYNNISRISEFSVSSADAMEVNSSTEEVILEVNQPQGNHEGGTIAFGPDGYLYISIGDGGNFNDRGEGHVEDWYEVNEGGNGQDIHANLLGDILRIDINGDGLYSIPSDNPFVGKEGRDEIYAYGFRNPFRFSFDMSGNNRLFVGDAGQNLWEEISVVEKGGNYGWNVKEGTHCFDAEDGSELSSCPDVDILGNELIDPVIEMPNISNPDGGMTLTIIGGNVYRGNDIPGLHGKYIFGSFADGTRIMDQLQPTGELFVANPAGPGLWSFTEIELESSPDDIGHFLKGFGQDLDGEIYVAASENLGPSGNTGKIFKLVMEGK